MAMRIVFTVADEDLYGEDYADEHDGTPNGAKAYLLNVALTMKQQWDGEGEGLIYGSAIAIEEV